MYYILINNKRPIKTKTPIVNNQQAQTLIKNLIVTQIRHISLWQYIYYSIKYELHG